MTPKEANVETEVNREGYERLWGWFELSYASWLTSPRVVMHEMPDDWQMRMAVLLEEWGARTETLNEEVDLEFSVTAKRGNRFAAVPEWLCNYRRPDERIAALMRDPQAVVEAET